MHALLPHLFYTVLGGLIYGGSFGADYLIDGIHAPRDAPGFALYLSAIVCFSMFIAQLPSEDRRSLPAYAKVDFGAPLCLYIAPTAAVFSFGLEKATPTLYLIVAAALSLVMYVTYLLRTRTV